MAPKRCVRLHAEFKPMLSMLNVVLDLSECFGIDIEDGDAEPCFVDVEVNSITYRSAASNAVFRLQHLQLNPASCRGLRWCSPSELHLTLQAKASQGKGASIHCENGVISHVEEDSNTSNQDIVVDRIKQCQNRCYCAGCGRPVFTSKSVFKRVLPLPSENWSDFADIWFCHNHSHHSGSQHQDSAATPDTAVPLVGDSQTGEEQHKPQTLSPRPGDCLVSSLYLLVDSSQVCPTTVGVTPHTQRLVCMRCGNFIGFVKQKESRTKLTDKSEKSGGDIFKIYLHTIKFLSPDNFPAYHMDDADFPYDEVPEDQNDSMSEGLVEDFLCQLFRDQSRLFTSFRFIIQSSHEEHADNIPIVILVWLLDQNLEVFSADCSAAAVQSRESKEQVQATHVLKLLYKACFHSSRDSRMNGIEGTIFKMWERDNSVHGLDLPYPLCKQLLSLLIASTRQLPLSQRSLNTFHVGYLHKKQAALVTG